MDISVTMLRISYWVGAAADFLAAWAMLDQAVFARCSLLSGYVPDVPYRYAMALAASLMLGWTALLIWAERRPYDRRGVLLITIPVVLGLAGSGFFAVTVGFIRTERMAPIFIFQAALTLLFSSSLLCSKHAKL